MKLMSAASHYSSEARKGIAILVLGALAVIGLIYLVFAWHDAAAERLRQAEAEHEMVSARAAKAAREGATRLTEADSVAPMFLEGDTPGLAFARFQSLADKAATDAGLAVKRMQPVDTGDGEAGTPYRLNVDVEGSIEQLRDFLANIESSLPVMFVTGLEIQPAGAAEATGEGEQPGNQYPSEALRTTVRIEAYGWRAQP